MFVGNKCRQTLLCVSTGNKWIRKRCSDVHGDLSLVVDGLRCKRCDGTILEINIEEYLVVDGETYGCVKSFCFMCDTGDGAHLAPTPRIRNGLMKF